MPLFSFSQDVFTYKNGGKILQYNKNISPSQIRSQFEYNKNIMDYYNAGRSKKTFGNILLYGGLATVVTKFIIDGTSDIVVVNPNGSESFKNYSPLLHILGGAMVLASIPIKIGYSKKIKKAVDLMNDEIKNQKTSSALNSTITVSSNQIGITINF